MAFTREQERAGMLLALACLFAVLAGIHEYCEPGDDHTILYFRRVAVPIAFSFLVARFANYGIHVVNHESKIYTLDQKTTTYALNTEIKRYKIFLLGSHVILIAILAVELWLLVDVPILVCFGLIFVLQVAETWACWLDLVDARETSRPGSPQTMV